MFNANQTKDAIKNLPFDENDPNGEETIAMEAMKIENSFHEFLTHTYGQELSLDVEEIVWGQAYMEANDEGYQIIEDKYAGLVSFLNKVSSTS